MRIWDLVYFVREISLQRIQYFVTYSGTPIYCFDPNDDILRPRPVGCNIICCDHERGIYLDVSSSPEVGEERCESSCARFANSSHPLLPAPYNEANAILICCPENVECFYQV
jgi:hypothetical protein